MIKRRNGAAANDAPELALADFVANKIDRHVFLPSFAGSKKFRLP